jgi:hypothetical protein
MAKKQGIDDILKGGAKAVRALERKIARTAAGPEKRAMERELRRAGEEAMKDPRAMKQAQAQWSRIGGRIGHLNEAAGQSGKAGKAAKKVAGSSVKRAEGLGKKVEARPTEYFVKKRNQGINKEASRKAGGVNAPKKQANRAAKRVANKKAAAPKKPNKK